MTTPETNDELLGAATDMVRAIDELRMEMAHTKVYGRKNRQLIRWLIASVTFDVILSFGLAYSVHEANEASERATRAASGVVVACRAGNVARDLQTKLWDTVLSFPPPVGETPQRTAQRETQIAEFRRYINTAFAQQDCEKLRDDPDE